jgi:Domain of unknown function (DUF397)
LRVENAPTREEDGWFVSSYTNGNASCVQVKFAGPGTILVRDSKDRRAASPIISLPSHGWASLLEGITTPV